ncbi:MAG: hypothetical protein GY679_01425 [Mycoplasma sp.]|nr:hypothetical protein [Mycoplasma sp.]
MIIHGSGEVEIKSLPNGYYKTIEIEKVSKIDFSDGYFPEYVETEEFIEKSGLEEKLRKEIRQELRDEIMDSISWDEVINPILEESYEVDSKRIQEENIYWDNIVIDKIDEVLKNV